MIFDVFFYRNRKENSINKFIMTCGTSYLVQIKTKMNQVEYSMISDPVIDRNRDEHVVITQMNKHKRISTMSEETYENLQDLRTLENIITMANLSLYMIAAHLLSYQFLTLLYSLQTINKNYSGKVLRAQTEQRTQQQGPLTSEI